MLETYTNESAIDVLSSVFEFNGRKTMYDFCFTIPYGILLILGGVMGFVNKRSTMSLYGGGGTGIVLLLLSYVSLRQYRQGKLWKTGTALSLMISVALTIIMVRRYLSTLKIFPPFVVAVITASMSLFYIWSLFLGPLPKKRAVS